MATKKARTPRKAKTAIETRDASAGGLTPVQLQMIQYGFPSPTGTTVNEQTCLSVSAVYACVNLISTTIASLDQHVYTRLPDGGKKLNLKHQVERVINCYDHIITNKRKFWRDLMVNVLTTGNGYAEISRTKGKPNLLLLHLSRNVEIKEDRNGDIYYLLRKEQRSIQPEDMIHISCAGFSGVEGLSPIRSHTIAIGNAIASQEYINHFFGNDGRPQGILKSANKLDEVAAKKARDTWQEMQGGIGNAGKTAIMGPGWDYQQIQLSPHDAEIVAYMNFSIADVARIFMVPISLLNAQIETAAYASSVESNQQFLNMCLRNWLTQIEAEIHSKLFTSAEKPKYFTEYRVEGLLRADDAARATYYQTLFNIGAITQNEIRAGEGLNPIDNGDLLYVPVNNLAPTNAPVEDDAPGETAPAQDTDLFRSIEPVIYDQVGRLVRRGFNASKKGKPIEDLRDHAIEVLKPYTALASRCNPQITLDDLTDSLVEGVLSVEREADLGDVVRRITLNALKRDLTSIHTVWNKPPSSAELLELNSETTGKEGS